MSGCWSHLSDQQLLKLSCVCSVCISLLCFCRQVRYKAEMALHGPNGGNIHVGINSSGPNSGQQDPRLHSNSQDPGMSSHPQHHVSARPVFYIHAQPPPLPFLHYQWPMPFSYNPFAGFPGMGYGMVMPPFHPPPPYMEAPSYILPHPPVQAVDYRRLAHSQVHVSTAPFQNPNQTRRARPSHALLVRETVNSEVQTEPPHRGVSGYNGGSLTTSSDSGRGTTSSSPSSTSGSQKGAFEVENYALPNGHTEDRQIKRPNTSSTFKHHFNVLHPSGTKIVRSCIGAIQDTQKSCKESDGQETVPPCHSHRCNVWSASSPDSMDPVCSSSQQEDEVVKERRVSIPDILMSWTGGVPQETNLAMADKVLPQNDHQLLSSESEVRRDKSVYQSPPGSQTDPVLCSTDSEAFLKIVKLPFVFNNLLSESREDSDPVESIETVSQCTPYGHKLLNSLNKIPDDEQTKCDETSQHAATAEIIPYPMLLKGCQAKRKMNESVWSVESLIPFIPTKEWLMQNDICEPEVIIEMEDEAENCRHSTQNGNWNVRAGRQTSKCSSDSVPLSDSWLIFSTPAEKPSVAKEPGMEHEIHVSEMRGVIDGQNMAPSEKDPLASLTCLQSKLIASPPLAVGENGSSEPEANQSPNQEFIFVNEQQEISRVSPEQERTLILNFTARQTGFSTGHSNVQERVGIEVHNGVCVNEKFRNEQLCVPKVNQKTSQVLPSKGHLVDCGVQCTELKVCGCGLNSSMLLNERWSSKYSEIKWTNNGETEGICMTGHMPKTRRGTII